MKSTLALVLAVAVCVSARMLVNETVYIQASVNVTKQKQYVDKDAPIEDADLKALILKLYETIKGLSSSKPGVDEYTRLLCSKAGISIPTTLGPLDLPSYTSQNDQQDTKHPAMNGKEITKSPVPERGNHDATEDEFHEATTAETNFKIPDNATQAATLSTKPDHEKEPKLRVFENSTSHTPETEPTRNTSFVQDDGFLDNDANRLNINVQHSSTHPQIPTIASGIDSSAQVKEVSDSDSKGLARTVDSLTLQTSALPKTSLSDLGSSYTPISYDPRETETSPRSEGILKNRSNDFTHNTDNLTHSTVATLSLQKTNISEDDLQHSYQTTDSLTLFPSSDSDTPHNIDDLSQSTSAVRDGNLTLPDSYSNSTSSPGQYNIVRNCYGVTRVVPLITDFADKRGSIDADQMSTGMYSTVSFPFSDSEGQRQNEPHHEASSAKSFVEHGPINETHHREVRHGQRSESSATGGPSQGVRPSESTVLSDGSYSMEVSSPTEHSSYDNAGHLSKSDQEDPRVQPTRLNSPRNHPIGTPQDSKNEPTISDDSSQGRSQHDPKTKSHSTKSSLGGLDHNFDSAQGKPQKDYEGPEDIHKDPEIPNRFGLVDLEDESRSTTKDINLNHFQVGDKTSATNLSDGTKGERKFFRNRGLFSEDGTYNLVETNISSRVKRGELPFVVSLQDKSGHHFCCGSILTSTWILSAAHCFRPVWRRDATNLQVIAGSLKLPGILNDTQVLEVDYIIWHESFLIDDFTHLKDDIAVLKLTSEMIFNDVVGISPLLMDRDWSQQYKVVLGFSSFYPSELLRIKMTSFLDGECRSALSQDYFNDFVCLKDPLECLMQEDSGGPVIVDGLQTGVASYPSTRMTGFLRISSYFSWIQRKTGYVWPKFTPVGQVAGKRDFPFVVMLQSKDRKHHCTGTILNPDWVLAPRHCLQQGEDPSKYEVFAGLIEIVDAYITARNISDIKWQEQGNRHGRHRFALLQLEKSLRTSDAIQPCRLPEQNYIVDFNEPVVAIGWQNVLLGASITQQLHYINVTLLTTEACVNRTGSDTEVLCADPMKPLLKGMMGSVVVQNGVVVAVSGEDQSQFIKIQSMVEWITSIIN